MDCSTLDYLCQIKPTSFQKEFAYEPISDDDESDENVSDDEDVEIENADEPEDEDRHTLSRCQVSQANCYSKTIHNPA